MDMRTSAEQTEGGDLSPLLERLPPEVAQSLTLEQRVALWNALNPNSWRRFPVNIRVSMPLARRRVFLTVLGGTERRAPERRQVERRLNPLLTLGNLLFFIGLMATIYMGALALFLGAGSIIRF